MAFDVFPAYYALYVCREWIWQKRMEKNELEQNVGEELNQPCSRRERAWTPIGLSLEQEAVKEAIASSHCETWGSSSAPSRRHEDYGRVS